MSSLFEDDADSFEDDFAENHELRYLLRQSIKPLVTVTASTTDAEIDDLARELRVKAYAEEELVLNEDVLWCMLVKWFLQPELDKKKKQGH